MYQFSAISKDFTKALLLLFEIITMLYDCAKFLNTGYVYFYIDSISNINLIRNVIARLQEWSCYV